MSKYPLIIFEGIECSGKSTQLKNVVIFLKKNKKKFLYLREPGGSNNSEKLRKLILNKKSDFNKFSDFLLYMASRSENIEKIIKKYYKKKIILIDRFIYSTLAYQHYGFGINKNLIESLNNYLLTNIKPDHIFFHTVSNKNLKKRLQKRRIKNKYDKFDFKYYTKVQNGFKKIFKNKKNVTLINSDDQITLNKNTIIKRLQQLLND
tara:strand:+ start:233 stop:850 length:618 start_codon:yes stop_codon:yes gene_type:complete